MNVLMTADAVGGVWTYSLELADALAEHGIATTLAVMGDRLSAEQRAELRRSRVDRCFASDFALEWQQDWSSLSRSCDWLRTVAEQVQPDIVHVNGYVHAALGWTQPVVVVAHSCVLSWFEAVRRQAAPFEWSRYAAEVERGLAAADLVVAPTQAMLDALRRQYVVDAEARVIPNGVAPLELPARPRSGVLAAGRLWDEAKNVSALIRVAPRLAAPVAIAGDLHDVHPRAVERLGLIGRRALRARMASAAVFCAPARYEPFGLAPLEAGLAGCALVLGDIPSLREVWGDAALYVDPDDDDALVAALEEALARAAELGVRAHGRAASFHGRTMGDRYADAYEQLLTRTLDRTVVTRA